MRDELESVARVGLAAWVGEGEHAWDTPTVLGTLGEDLYLVEIEASNREVVLPELVDRYDARDSSLKIEVALFGDAGGFFASSLDFLAQWPKSAAEAPAEVFIDERHRATFDRSGDDLVMSVRHALRPSGGPPRRRFRFRPDAYDRAMTSLASESRRLRDDLTALATQRAPHKLDSLRDAFARWPADSGAPT